jgi:hypothetical protein
MKPLRRRKKATPQDNPPPLSGGAQFEPHAHAAFLAYSFQPVPKLIPIESMYREVERLSGLPDKEKQVLIEDMLMDQAHSLQAMFTWLAMRVESCQLIDHMLAYGHLALKAQRQSRATLATVAELRNPSRATFIKNTAGHQQINLGAPGQGPVFEKLSENFAERTIKGIAACDDGQRRSEPHNPS